MGDFKYRYFSSFIFESGQSISWWNYESSFFAPHQHSHAYHWDECILHWSCLYKSTHLLQDGVLNVPIADHLPIFCSIPCQSSLDGIKIHIKFRNTSDDCLSKFKSDVEILSHFHVYDNLSKDDKFLILNNIFENSLNKNCPIKSQCIALKSHYSPWLNNTLRKALEKNTDSIIYAKKIQSLYRYINSVT